MKRRKTSRKTRRHHPQAYLAKARTWARKSSGELFKQLVLVLGVLICIYIFLTWR